MAAAAPKGTVTLMFSDIEGSTRLLRRLGDDYADVLSMHHELVREAFVRHRGYEVDMQGDAFFVTFASANDAVAAAADVQRALAAHEWPDGHEIRIRIGLHTGEPSFVDGRYVGLDVHRGARVMAAGHGGQVLVSEATHALLDERVRLRDLGAHRLKDLSEPQRLYQLEIDGLAAEFPPLKTLENRPTNLPAATSTFIGRERELTEVQSLLVHPDVRLLTLTGPGGAGKTRLALQVAADLIEHFSSGVFFVSLSPIRDWELVVPAIARALGLREYPGEPMLDTLTEYVRDKELLLLLDNVEQVLAAAPAVAGLLASAPELRVLATSRVPLNLSGESTYAVPPLALPAARRLRDVAELERSEAVRLFVDRAHAAAAEFALTSDNAEAVAEICRRLDGLPLAIELAAPRVRVLTPAALLRRLDQRLSILTGGAQDLDERQRTLRATIAWSHELLLDDEKALFARLGSLVGGCRLEAAEALCDLGGSLGTGVLDGLGSLVDKSLLRRTTDSDGEPRFWMLETIREFALEMLEASGGTREARRVHALWYADEAERLDIGSRTGDRRSSLGRLDDDYANFRAAIGFARETRDGDLMLRLVTALWGFWSTRGYVAEGRGALEDAFELTDRRPPRAVLGLCTLRVLSGTSEGVLEDAREAVRASEEIGDEFSLSQAWNLVGRIEGGAMGHMEKAEQAFRNALSYAERGRYPAEKAEAIGWLLLSTVWGPVPAPDGIVLCDEFAESEQDDPAIQAWCAVARAVLEAMSGDFERARELLAAGTRELDGLGLTVWAANTAQEAFLIESIAGNPAAATATLRSGYETLDRMGERGLLSTVAGFLAQALYAEGDYREAARFSRASEDAAATDDVFSQMLWRSSRAKILVRQGDFERAEALAQEAVRLGEATDLLSTRADMLCDLAEVLRLAGRPVDALPALTKAARLYEQKGNLPALERARSLAAELSPASSSA